MCRLHRWRFELGDPEGEGVDRNRLSLWRTQPLCPASSRQVIPLTREFCKLCRCAAPESMIDCSAFELSIQLQLTMPSCSH